MEKVLVVDDCTLVLYLIRMFLEKEYQVKEVESGSEALACLSGFRPSIAVINIIMPEMDGFLLAERLHRMFPSLPVLFMAGYIDDIFPVAYSNDRRIDFISKPFEMKKLKAKIRALLGRCG